MPVEKKEKSNIIMAFPKTIEYRGLGSFDVSKRNNFVAEYKN